MGDKNSSSGRSSTSELMQELVNKLNGAYVLLAGTLLLWDPDWVNSVWEKAALMVQWLHANQSAQRSKHILPQSHCKYGRNNLVGWFLLLQTENFEIEWAEESFPCLSDVHPIESYLGNGRWIGSRPSILWFCLSSCVICCLVSPVSYLMMVMPAWRRWMGPNGHLMIHSFCIAVVQILGFLSAAFLLKY